MSERFQHIDQLLNLTRRTLGTENDRLKALRHASQTTQKLLSKTIEQTDLAIKHLHESESLYLALKDLSNNRLSHHLVDKDQLKDSPTHLSTIVKQHTPNAELVYKSVGYYYIESNIATAFYAHSNSEKTLIVIVTVPTTRNKIAAPLPIWKITYFSLHSMKEKTCALALFGINLEEIKKLCKFKVIFGTLKPEVYRRGENKILLNNISALTINRVKTFPDSNANSDLDARNTYHFAKHI